MRLNQDGYSGATEEVDEARDMADYGKQYGGSLKNLKKNYHMIQQSSF